ncbi:MAG: hypothetical protein QNJ16_04860 [Rhodobacter sp.]|nr:hypothetical protein [Rhodobacter sp.]
MDEQALLKFVGLVAMYVAMSILTIGSLSLSNAISQKVFEPNPKNGGKPPPGSKESPYKYDEGPAGLLRATIQNYSNKVFRYYLTVSILVFTPIALDLTKDFLGAHRYNDGVIFFWGSLKFLNPIIELVPPFCLGVSMVYCLAVVFRASSFKSLWIEIVDTG